MKDRFRALVAVHLFLINEEKILLLRRYNTGYEDGNYSVPAGHIDGNETVTNSMIREALEEITVKVNPKDLKVIHVMHRNAKTSNWERIDFFLECNKWQGEISIGEKDKCDDLSWFKPNELPENTIPYIRSAITDYTKGVYYSEFGWEEN